VPGLVRFLTHPWRGLLGASFLAVAVAWTALGHGGRGLIVDPSTSPPGGEVSVHGSYLWTDQPVTIVLLAIDGTMWTLGDAFTSGNGDLESSVVLPPDLPDATYSILARAANGEDAHVELVVRREGDATATLVIGGVAIALVALLVAFVVAVVLRRRRGIAV
jgi:hypothetical protein